MLLWALAADLCGALVRTLIPEPPIIGYLAELALFGILTYFTLVRYCAKYTYTIAPGYLRVTRRIGRNRHRELEIKISKIKSVSKTPPSDTSLKREVYRTTFLSKKNLAYLVYRDDETKVLVFEPSEELYKMLKQRKEKNS